MNTTPPILSVLVGERFACVKVVGRANFNVSVDFRNTLSGLQARGYNYIVIELSQCALMDSTFLGVLTGFGLKATEGDGATKGEVIELRNANERIMELLDSLGVLHFFKIKKGEVENADAMEAASAECSKATKEQITSACLEAHQTLMAVNPQNVGRFKDVTKFLAEDLEKLKQKK